MSSVKEINVRNRMYSFSYNIINTKTLGSHEIKTDEKSFKKYSYLPHQKGDGQKP